MAEKIDDFKLNNPANHKYNPRSKGPHIPRSRASPKQMTLAAAAMTIPKGANIATNTGPVLCRHHAVTPISNALPKIPCLLKTLTHWLHIVTILS